MKSRGLGDVYKRQHEAIDDAVEDRTVVERAFVGAGGVGLGVLLGALRQANEVGYGLRRVVAEQIDGDVALVGVQNCGCSLISHGDPLY